MAELYGRVYSLEIGTLKLDATVPGADALRVAFEIARDDTPYPNTAEFRIYNLTRDHAKELAASKTGVTARFAAGYGDNCQILFFGTLADVSTQRDGPDLVTVAKSEDGLVNAARFSRSYPKLTPTATVVADLAKAMGLNADTAIPFLADAAPFKAPRMLSGAAFDLLSSVLSREGYTWTIQDGQLFLVAEEIPGTTYQGYLLSPSTGLLDTVDVAKDREGTTISGSALLLPDLRPGHLLQIDCARWQGLIRVKTTKHVGDFMGPDWAVEFEGIPV